MAAFRRKIRDVLAVALPVERGKGKAVAAVAPADRAGFAAPRGRRLLEADRKNPTSGAEFTCRFVADGAKRALDPARARV
jgi:hypothetical protein